MLAHSFMAVATAAERDTQPPPEGLITLTVNEFRRLFDALLVPQNGPWPACSPGPHGAENTNTEPAKATTADGKTNDHELLLQY